MINTSTIETDSPYNRAVNDLNPSERQAEIRRKARKLRKACSDFQATLLGYMLKTMRKSVPRSNLLGNGYGGEIFTDLFDMKVAESISASSGFGMDRMLFKQLAPQALGKNWKDELGDFILQPHGNVVHVSDSQTKTSPYDLWIRSAGRKYNIAPILINTIIEAESAGDYRAVSAKGAKGLMQLMDSTAVRLGVKDPFDPRQNIDGGVRYLRELLDRYGGNLKLALAAYNAGPAAVDRYNNIPPYPETREYVKGILDRMNTGNGAGRGGT